MKFTTIYQGANKIELFNSLIGKETVKVNGLIVSSEYSFSGTDHVFTIDEDGAPVECKLVTGFGLNGVVIDFYKNGQPIIESPKTGCTVFFLIGAVIGIVISIFNHLL